jgi:hypothetical protein
VQYTDRPLNTAASNAAVNNADVEPEKTVNQDLELIPASSKAWTPAQEINDRRAHHNPPPPAEVVSQQPVSVANNVPKKSVHFEDSQPAAQ